MKKSLVLAMAMALGVTASAYAANPFSDVPAGHWAYDSISKLAAAGVIEGYGDDTFRGDRLMTRYEMAQIVAKAMSKGANVNKLAAEFADELDALGVRVAALEKKSDNVKITGYARYRWGLGSAIGATRQRVHTLRSRIWFNGQINDTWKYTGMLQNQENFRTDTGEENTNFQRAYLTGRIGGVGVVAGRIPETLFVDGDPYDSRADAIHLSYGDKVKIEGWYGKPTDYNIAAAAPFNFNYSKYYGARLSYTADKFGVWAEYDKFSNDNRPVIMAFAGNPDRHIWGIGANGKFGDFGLAAKFLHGKASNVNTGKKGGWSVEATYKGANKAKPGSWGLGVKYYDMGNWTYLAGMKTWDAFDAFNQPDGYKGWRVKGDYVVAKNMVTTLQYYDLKGKGNGGGKEKSIVADLVVTF